MALEQLRAEIAMLVQQMEGEPEDIHELHARIRSKLNEIKAMGMPLPDDLVALERRLDGEERAAARSARASGAGVTESVPRRTARRPPAKRAKPPVARKAKKAAKATKKTATAKKAGRSAPRKTRRPAKAAKKARGSAAKKAKRGGRRR
jgi:hypothetical protein